MLGGLALNEENPNSMQMLQTSPIAFISQLNKKTVKNRRFESCISSMMLQIFLFTNVPLRKDMGLNSVAFDRSLAMEGYAR
jgi:hypothetical protein